MFQALTDSICNATNKLGRRPEESHESLCHYISRPFEPSMLGSQYAVHCILCNKIASRMSYKVPDRCALAFGSVSQRPCLFRPD